MNTLSNYLILLMFLIEVVCFTYFEKKVWKTFYTPLNILMLPYAIILLFTLSLPKSLGFVQVYYPSILVWVIGLLVFFIPSMLLGYVYNRKYFYLPIQIKKPESNTIITYFAGALLFLMYFYLFFSNSSQEVIGSDEFAEATMSGGIWGHVRTALLGLMILFIYLLDKKHRYYWLFILAIVLVSIIYQVKSWIFIPVLSGLIALLYTRKLKLKLSFILLFILFGVGVFFLSYYLLLVYATDDGEFTEQTFDFIYMHMYHYLASGVFGLSMYISDINTSVPHIEYLFSPILNLFNTVSEGGLVVPINSFFYDTGWAGTNVLTFFGTILLHAGFYGAFVYVFLFSVVVYSLKIYLYKSQNLFVLSIYSWICALLFMGWFEFYFFHLIVLEIPILLLLLNWISKLNLKNKIIK